MLVTDREYVEHCVFSELERYIDFYESFSMSVFNFCTMGTKAVFNFESYVYSSIQGTLESTRNVLKDGRINDAYALLRKYYDSTIINVYSSLYLQDHFSIENFIVEKINNWLQGKERLPEYRIMSDYIRSSDKLTVINDLLYQDDRYKRVRDHCNDHTHYNFFNNVLLNDKNIHLPNRLQSLDGISADAQDIFILHLAYVFFLNDHYMMSSDYLDALDCGMLPENNSQYWVSPFVQEIMDDILAKKRPDIVAAIKMHSCMHLG